MAALTLAVAIGVAITLTRPLGYDLIAYVDAAQRLLDGRPLYPPPDGGPVYLGAGAFLYPPPVAVLFVPLALLPHGLSTALWTVLLATVAVAVALVWTRGLPITWRLWSLAAAALFLPLVAEITLGNVNLLTLGLCSVAWSRRARQTQAGAALALALGLKGLPVLLPVFFVLTRHGRVVLSAIAFLALATAVTFPWLSHEWSAYLRLLTEVVRAPDTQAYTLLPALLSGTTGRVALVVAAIAVTCAAALAARTRPGHGERALAVALASVPLVAPGLWYPYLVFALPLLLSLVRDAVRASSHTAARVILGGSWVAMEIPKRSGAPDIAFIGLVALLAAGMVSLRRGDGNGLHMAVPLRDGQSDPTIAT